MNERKLQELWTCAMAGLAFAVVFILIAAALSTALAQQMWLWGGPPAIYPGCPNNYSPDGTTPDADPKVVYACWKTLNNWMPIPSCVQPYNGTTPENLAAMNSITLRDLKTLCIQETVRALYRLNKASEVL